MSLAPLALPLPDDAQEWVESLTRDGLATARERAERLRTSPPADPLDLLREWDEVARALSGVAAAASLLANVHPLEPVRTACEAADREVDRLLTELRQDRGLYDVFAAADPAGLDPAAARLLDKTLEDFRRAGVDLDDATRARLAEINERLTQVGQEFSRTIRDDVRTVRVPAERLAGLPQDWLDAHPVDADGLVTVTTDYPDAVPVRMFVHDAGVRRQVTVAFLERGWPQNEPLLREMFALRHELATLVGYADWASYDAGVKMIGDGPAIPAFIDRIAAAADAPMRRDLDQLLERYRRDVPDATAIDTADSLYYEELVRQERHDVDAQRVRAYFDFTKVRRGLLEVTGRLFGLRYEPVPDATVWHEDVAAYDVLRDAPDGPVPVGRIYLDLHPREGKYKHAAQFTLVDGLAGRQLPEGVLVCNFSRGLMEHDHVVTLFHEFGHLVHHVLGGHGGWTRFSGVATEWDFVEAPSQLLEEWAWDPEVLRTFAADADGEPIPEDLVERMRAADEFGKGYHARTQMFYAAMSYWFHTSRPDDLTAAMRELQERYSPFPYIDGTHMFASFGHLGGYSSAYYTYMWSLVIAKDLFSAFDPADLFDPVVAGRYRDRVLALGGSRDAADLVTDFLGRPYTFDAYAAWLAR
ncbi:MULTISPECIES: M3 family metallopeptidase [unclassified Nocardioides]|uniref:M3 family metallopeptidase n=1 Tax=unclassified Nocardioides TaxID=2615069 RepID=UPI0000EB63ED|nr:MULTISPECIES: M3 family metallopeptidase [unclassified Nocardioides]ABL84108.1 Thimet oligopeptidase [Nocardioides sp. JS614]